MLRRGWPIVVASCALLAACLDDQQALRSSEPLYTMVFFATDSTALSKRARDQIADFVANPMGPIKTMPKAKVCVGGHSDKTGTEPVNREVGAAPRRRRHKIPRRARRATGADRDDEPRQFQAAGRHRAADVGDFQPTRRDRGWLFIMKMRRRLGALCALCLAIGVVPEVVVALSPAPPQRVFCTTGSSVVAPSKDNDNVLQSAAENFWRRITPGRLKVRAWVNLPEASELKLGTFNGVRLCREGATCPIGGPVGSY